MRFVRIFYFFVVRGLNRKINKELINFLFLNGLLNVLIILGSEKVEDGLEGKYGLNNIV